ncbi:GMC oxidoreductase [Lentithecium fluviatile CBS 122367]|uniref:GMC oxidoreductase n=1 Tax=Lentithecium fluviatile CBS 122367 TaxID=1168545 RepID=A0A6G1J3H8_9PLEO|nr:GMC oxidoreductase [Lentithecium fluviatile CBS 122367]
MFQLRLLPLLPLILPTLATCPSHQVFNYIIVGAGPAGLVLANKLSANPNVTVAVIEAGDEQYTNPNVTRIDAFGLALNTSIDWSYTSAPQKYLSDKTLTYYSGKALGGTTTINGMTYLRAEKGQIDAWEGLGNPGWSWDALFKYYKEQEKFQVPDAEKVRNGASFEEGVHGGKGEVKVGWSSLFMEDGVFEMLRETSANMGIAWNKDPNGGRMGGFSTWPFTLDAEKEIRWDAARALYYPIAHTRPNLYVFLNTTATRILWSDSKATDGDVVATGVEIVTSTNDTRQTLQACEEVILAAGSLRSPALLEHSGIGNPSVLGPIGIETIVDLPSVGANLQDQPNMAISYASLTNWTGYPCFVSYLTAADIFGANLSAFTSELSANISAYAAQIVADAPENETTTAIEEALLKLQADLVFAENGTVPLAELLWAPGAGSITCVFWTLLPFSKGNVHITSPEAAQQPAINPNFLQLPIDTLIQAAAAVKVRKYFATAPLSSHVTVEVAPGLGVVPKDAGWRDEKWVSWIKQEYNPNYHPVSSAAMRRREWGGVVDANGMVYGSRNVRVVDAGVFPTQISGHLSASVYAVAGKIADAIIAGKKGK